MRFRGRKKNVIVTPAGLNVYPEDAEQALRNQPNVKDCVVIPMNRGGNAEPCAVLLVDDGSRDGAVNSADHAGNATRSAKYKNQSAKHAVENANASLAEYQRVRSWIVWPDADFPRTPTGKPRLAAITAAAAQILDGTGSANTGTGRNAQASNDLAQLLQKFSTANAASGENAHPANALRGADANANAASPQLEAQLNLSSLDRVELMSALEDRYQVELSETAFAEARTVGDMQQLLSAPAARLLAPQFTRFGLCENPCDGCASLFTMRSRGRRRRSSPTRKLLAAKIFTICAAPR